MISNLLPAALTRLYAVTKWGVKPRHGPHCMGYIKTTLWQGYESRGIFNNMFDGITRNKNRGVHLSLCCQKWRQSSGAARAARLKHMCILLFRSSYSRIVCPENVEAANFTVGPFLLKRPCIGSSDSKRAVWHQIKLWCQSRIDHGTMMLNYEHPWRMFGSLGATTVLHIQYMKSLSNPCTMHDSS